MINQDPSSSASDAKVFDQWLGARAGDAKATERSCKDLRKALSGAWRAQDVDMAQEACRVHGAALMPRRTWVGALESDRAWEQALGGSSLHGELTRDPAKQMGPLARDMVWASAKGFKEWLMSTGAAWPAHFGDFAKGRLLHGEPTAGFGRMCALFSDGLVAGDDSASRAMLMAITKIIDSDSICPSSSKMGPWANRRALEMMAQCAHGALGAGDDGLDQSMSMALLCAFRKESEGYAKRLSWIDSRMLWGACSATSGRWFEEAVLALGRGEVDAASRRDAQAALDRLDESLAGRALERWGRHPDAHSPMNDSQRWLLCAVEAKAMACAQGLGSKKAPAL